MPLAIFLVGIPASGKSTFIEKFMEDENRDDWVVISSDNYIEEKSKELGMTYSEGFSMFIKDASKHVNETALQAAKAGKNVIWDQTNLNVKSRANRVSIFKTHKKVAIIFPVPMDLQLRLRSRPGKNIPNHVVENMIASYEEPTESEGFHTIVMNSVSKRFYR